MITVIVMITNIFLFCFCFVIKQKNAKFSALFFFERISKNSLATPISFPWQLASWQWTSGPTFTLHRNLHQPSTSTSALQLVSPTSVVATSRRTARSLCQFWASQISELQFRQLKHHRFEIWGFHFKDKRIKCMKNKRPKLYWEFADRENVWILKDWASRQGEKHIIQFVSELKFVGKCAVRSEIDRIAWFQGGILIGKERKGSRKQDEGDSVRHVIWARTVWCKITPIHL